MSTIIQAYQGRASIRSRRRSVEFWESFDNCDNLLVNPRLYQSVFDSVVSDECLHMEIEVPHEGFDETAMMTSSEFATHSVVSSDRDESSSDEADEFDIFSLGAFDDDDETPRTPTQRQGRFVDFDKDNVHEINPDLPYPVPIDVYGLVELHMTCQRSLKKLANSMRRTEATRAVVKRQRIESPREESEGNFFNSYREREMAESRRTLYQSIEIGASHST